MLELLHFYLDRVAGLSFSYSSVYSSVACYCSDVFVDFIFVAPCKLLKFMIFFVVHVGFGFLSGLTSDVWLLLLFTACLRCSHLVTILWILL